MKLLCRIAGSLLLSLFIPVLAWAAIPFTRITDEVHDALRGCRWRRHVSVVPAMPRAEEDDRVRLQLNFDKGPPYFVEMTTETTQTMSVMGQDVTQTHLQSFFWRVTPLGVNQENCGRLRMQIIGIKMKIDIGGVNIAYDSTEDRPASDPMTAFFKTLLNADLTLAIDRHEMKVKKIEGHDELIKNMGVTSPQMEPLLKSILSTDGVTHMVEPNLFGFLPRQPVRRGDTWRGQSRLDLGPIGGYRIEATYTYAGKKGPLERILVQTALKYEAPQNRAGLPFAVQNAELKSTAGTGDILFDPAKGRLAESTLRLALAGSLTIEVGGVNTQVELVQSQTARVRVTDSHPFPPPPKRWVFPAWPR